MAHNLYGNSALGGICVLLLPVHSIIVPGIYAGLAQMLRPVWFC